MALVYVFLSTVVAFWIGHPLIRLSFRNELTNAAFRYALVRLRDAGESVGLYRGEDAERGQLMTRFAAVIANYRAFVRRSIVFIGWNRSMSQIVANPASPWISRETGLGLSLSPTTRRARRAPSLPYGWRMMSRSASRVAMMSRPASRVAHDAPPGLASGA